MFAYERRCGTVGDGWLGPSRRNPLLRPALVHNVFNGDLDLSLYSLYHNSHRNNPCPHFAMLFNFITLSPLPLLSPNPQSRQAFSPVVGIGTPPPTQPQASVPPPPSFGGGRRALGTSLAGEGLGSPNSDEGTYTVELCIYQYFVT